MLLVGTAVLLLLLLLLLMMQQLVLQRAAAAAATLDSLSKRFERKKTKTSPREESKQGVCLEGYEEEFQRRSQGRCCYVAVSQRESGGATQRALCYSALFSHPVTLRVIL